MPASPAAVRQQNQLRKLSPRQGYYSSRFFSPHKTLWKNKSRPNGRFGRAKLFQQGMGAEAALGTRLVSVAACEGLLHLWPAALGQAAPCPYGGGDTASLQAAQKSFSGVCNRQQVPAPCPWPLSPCHASPAPSLQAGTRRRGRRDSFCHRQQQGGKGGRK